MIFFNKKTAGFTIIELIVSVSIIILMTGLFLNNYHSTNKRSELSLAAQKLASDIRLMQSRSLSSTKFGGNVPNGGWGIYFNKTTNPGSYIFFADDNFPNPPTYLFDTLEEDEEINLPANITLGHVGNSVSIVFEPPAPATYINGLNLGSINIVLTDGESTKTVLVNFFGLVDVMD